MASAEFKRKLGTGVELLTFQAWSFLKEGIKLGPQSYSYDSSEALRDRSGLASWQVPRWTTLRDLLELAAGAMDNFYLHQRIEMVTHDCTPSPFPFALEVPTAVLRRMDVL